MILNAINPQTNDFLKKNNQQFKKLIDQRADLINRYFVYGPPAGDHADQLKARKRLDNFNNQILNKLNLLVHDQIHQFVNKRVTVSSQALPQLKQELYQGAQEHIFKNLPAYDLNKASVSNWVIKGLGLQYKLEAVLKAHKLPLHIPKNALHNEHSRPYARAALNFVSLNEPIGYKTNGEAVTWLDELGNAKHSSSADENMFIKESLIGLSKKVIDLNLLPPRQRHYFTLVVSNPEKTYPELIKQYNLGIMPNGLGHRVKQAFKVIQQHSELDVFKP